EGARCIREQQHDEEPHRSLRGKQTASDGEHDERDSAGEQEPGRHVNQDTESRDQQQAREASERNGREELGEWVARERRENPDGGVGDRREDNDRRRPKGRTREGVDTPPYGLPGL